MEVTLLYSYFELVSSKAYFSLFFLLHSTAVVMCSICDVSTAIFELPHKYLISETNLVLCFENLMFCLPVYFTECKVFSIFFYL